MKQFFASVKDAVYAPKFYSEFLKSDKSGFGHFFKLTALLAIIYTIGFGAWMLPKVKPFLTEASQQVVESFPEGLIVTFDHGAISTNGKEPIKFPTPSENDTMKMSPANVLVIDTKAEASQQSLNKYDTTVLVTKHSIVYRDERRGQIRIQDLSMLQTEKFEISRATIKQAADAVVPKLVWFAPFVLGVVFLGVMLAYLLLLLWALFGAIIVLVAGAVLGKKFSYGRAYQATLYLMTLPILVTGFMRFIGIWTFVPHIQYLFTLILMAVTFANLAKKSTPEHHAVQHPNV